MDDGSRAERRDDEFAHWYAAHHDRIRALSTRILRDRAAAEDVTQETLLRAWERRSTLRDEDVGAWLSVVARNLCISRLRKESRWVPLDAPATDVSDPSADPATTLEHRETRHNVRRALALLGARQRRVLYLHEFDQKEYDQIGSEIGLSAEGARSVAFRARRIVRDHLVAVGEGVSGIIVGLRLRLHLLQLRMRNWQSVGVEIPMLQAGLTLVVALGVGFSSPAAAFSSSAHAAAPLRRSTQRFVAAPPEHTYQGSRTPLGALVPGGLPRAKEPTLGKPPVQPIVRPGDYYCDTYPRVDLAFTGPGGRRYVVGFHIENKYRDPTSDFILATTYYAYDTAAGGRHDC